MSDVACPPPVSAAVRFREFFAQARAVLATVGALDREMAQCLVEMRRQEESPARLIAARTALESVREVAAAAKRIAPEATAADARPDVMRVA